MKTLAYEHKERPAANKVYLQANGGTDIEGEWHFNGSYDITVRSGTFGNFYTYKGYLWRHLTKKGKRSTQWSLTLDVTGGSYDRLTLRILDVRTPSLKKARALVVSTIQAFEKTDRYRNEFYPRVIAWHRRRPILKRVGDSYQWVASTYLSGWEAVHNNSEYKFSSKPLENGVFYVREAVIEYDWQGIPFAERDYSRVEDYLVFRGYKWSRIEVGTWSVSGGPIDPDSLSELDAYMKSLDFDPNEIDKEVYHANS